ncbi:hypothetical protein VTG60DRAFT_3125 [Thermothelomyces hinnuleus]
MHLYQRFEIIERNCTRGLNPHPVAAPGTLCLAWAEGRLNKWPMCLTWQEDRMEGAWVPTTDDHDEEAEISKGGNGVCRWKHVLWLRAHRARIEELATV